MEKTFDMHAVTFRDENGEEVNAFDYLVEEGNLAVPGGRYGSDTYSCAAVACLVFAIQVDAGCEDSIDGLDGTMSSVVNSGDDIATLIREYAGIVGADPEDYLDDHDLEGDDDDF